MDRRRGKIKYGTQFFQDGSSQYNSFISIISFRMVLVEFTSSAAAESAIQSHGRA